MRFPSFTTCLRLTFGNGKNSSWNISLWLSEYLTGMLKFPQRKAVFPWVAAQYHLPLVVTVTWENVQQLFAKACAQLARLSCCVPFYPTIRSHQQRLMMHPGAVASPWEDDALLSSQPPSAQPQSFFPPVEYSSLSHKNGSFWLIHFSMKQNVWVQVDSKANLGCFHSTEKVKSAFHKILSMYMRFFPYTRKLSVLPRVKCIRVEHSEFKHIRLLYFVNISLTLVALSGFFLVSDFSPCSFPSI